MPWAAPKVRFAVSQGPVLIWPPPLPSVESPAVVAFPSEVLLPPEFSEDDEEEGGADEDDEAGEEEGDDPAAESTSFPLAEESSLPWQAVSERPATRARVARAVFVARMVASLAIGAVCWARVSVSDH
ncbi:hypothetical protein AB0L99_22005 [Streptomyces sp. NPDC051954]|uniref:hypothetical protein n=1 Tax=unclassified Streptomyces TaxID=2593676 RepID=UPI0034373EA1